MRSTGVVQPWRLEYGTSHGWLPTQRKEALRRGLLAETKEERLVEIQDRVEVAGPSAQRIHQACTIG